jgi:hypothetical protein
VNTFFRRAIKKTNNNIADAAGLIIYPTLTVVLSLTAAVFTGIAHRFLKTGGIT